mmetsp:Transcript_16718/g.41974  ORF Transcript_16718/g.41974 Transcript_16718/m.41974 type:complete len:204 (-) Transcript_16718:528-1139(-)
MVVLFSMKRLYALVLSSGVIPPWKTETATPLSLISSATSFTVSFLLAKIMVLPRATSCSKSRRQSKRFFGVFTSTVTCQIVSIDNLSSEMRIVSGLWIYLSQKLVTFSVYVAENRRTCGDRNIFTILIDESLKLPSSNIISASSKITIFIFAHKGGVKLFNKVPGVPTTTWPLIATFLPSVFTHSAIFNPSMNSLSLRISDAL